VRGTERIGGRRPAGAHHDRDVVRATESDREICGRTGGEGGGIFCTRLTHAGTLTQPGADDDARVRLL
jgi:hypothetical protein